MRETDANCTDTQQLGQKYILLTSPTVNQAMSGLCVATTLQSGHTSTHPRARSAPGWVPPFPCILRPSTTTSPRPGRASSSPDSASASTSTSSTACPPDIGADTPRAAIAVFVSGGGSNFKAIHADILDGSINGDVSVVVTNAPSCAAASYARSHDIPIVVYPKSSKDTGSEPTTVCSTPQDLLDVLTSHNISLVVLAGYMKLVPLEIVQAFERKMLNIHPGLLPGPFGGPGMYGMNVHTAVVNSGSRVSGCTVHFVNEVFDDGPILGQAVVDVYIGDSPERVAARVLKREHELFPRCVRAFCDGRVGWRADGVPYIVERL